MNMARTQGKTALAGGLNPPSTQSAEVGAELLRTRARLAAELADAELLQHVSAMLIREHDVGALYERILDAATAIMRSDFASMQMLYPERGIGGELRLLGSRGFTPQAATFWEWVRLDSGSTCGEALRTGVRVIAPDVERCGFIAASEDLAVYRQTGIKAVQTTPLVSRDGQVLGMLSTHWSAPHEPGERELRLLDILVRQAADLLERCQMHDRERSARAAAEEANRTKSDFLAAMSHELRTPLNAIAGYVELLDMGLYGPVTEAQREALERVRKSEEHLLALVNDVLNFAKLEAGRVVYDIEDVALAGVLADVLPFLQPQLAAKSLTCDVHVARDVVVRADRDKLEQILINLLSNAVKFTASGGRITVETSTRTDGTESERPGLVFLRVSDTGIGIAREKQEVIFDPFVQVHRGLGASDGIGLGLAISRELARGMGGDLRVRSTESLGSRFTLTLLAPKR